MPERIPKSVAKRVAFRAIGSADHVTPATGKTIAITISKNGSAFGNPAAGATNATEISSGFYYFDLGTGDTGTAGPLAWRGAGTGIDDVGDVYEVVNATNAGFSALPDVASGSAGAVLTSGTGTAQLSVSGGVAQADAAKIGGQTASASGTITFPNATLASTTNITAGTITTTTNLTNLPAITAGWLTATGIAAGALNGKGDWNTTTPPTVGAIATAIWQDTTAGDFTAANSIGKSIMNGVALGTGLTVNDITTKTGYSLSSSQTFNVTGNITGNLSGSVGSVTGAVGSVTGAVGSVTGNVGGNVVGSVASVTGNVGGNVVGSVASVTAAVSVTGDLSATMKTSVEAAVWDATLASHLTAGTTGNALNAAGSAGDPWSTSLPGAYGTGSAGYILGTNLNATVSSRSSLDAAGVRTAVGLASANLDTQLGDIPALTWDVTLASHLTAGSTGNALNAAGSAGDPWATTLPGAYGAGSAGYIVGNQIDAAISSRMATYTQPTGFLAATFPSGTIANTTNITAGTITTTTNLTNAPTAGDLTATMKTSVENAVWDATMASHVAAGSTGAKLNTVLDPWTISLPGAYGAGSAGYLVGTYVNASIAAVKSKTDSLTFTIAGMVDSNVVDWKGSAAPAMTGDAYARLGAPAGASVSADIAAVKSEEDAIKAKTDLIPASPAAVGDIPTATQNADALLNRDMSAVSSTNSRSPLNALRFLRNKWALSGTGLTVYEEDDATPAWTAVVTTSPGADPISGNDPA